MYIARFIEPLSSNALFCVILLAGTGQVRISILDVNDNPPAFDQNTYTFSVNEDASIGKIVDRVTATDPDSGEVTSPKAAIPWLYDTCCVHRSTKIYQQKTIWYLHPCSVFMYMSYLW